MTRSQTIARRIHATALLSLIGATLCWGLVPAMLKFLARPEYLPDGFTANAIRYPIAALFWLPWLLMGLRNGQVRALWLVALVPTAFNVVGQTLWAIAPYHLDAGLMAFLYQLCSVWSILAAFVVFPDERRLARDRLFWIGTAAAVAGFVLLSLPSLLAGAGGSTLGILIIFLCGLCMAFYGVSVRYVLRDKHPLVLFSLVATYTSVGVLLAAPLGQPSALLRLSPAIMALVVASSLIGIAFAHGLFYIAVQRLGVAISYLVLMTTPLLSYTCSWFWLGERLTALQWLGSVILLAGSASAVHAHNRLRTAAPAPAEANPPKPG